MNFFTKKNIQLPATNQPDSRYKESINTILRDLPSNIRKDLDSLVVIKEVSAAYTFTTNDGIKFLLVTTGAADKIITLPPLNQSLDRSIIVIKVDAGAGDIILTAAGSDTINGSATKTQANQYGWFEIVGGSAEWMLRQDSAVASAHTQNTDTGLGTLGTKNPPIDADKAIYRDSTSSDALVTSTWTQVKAFLKTYFDTLYNLYVHPNHSGDVTSVGDGATTITNKQTVTFSNPIYSSQTQTVIASGAPTVNLKNDATNAITGIETTWTDSDLKLSTSKAILTKTNSTYLKLDQTAPQTIINGTPLITTQSIADNAILTVDDASAADNDYAKFTASGIEGVPYATVLSDIAAVPTSRTITATSPITIDGTTSADLDANVTIAHATTAGNVHIPTGGSEHQLLKNNGTSGTGEWATVTEDAGTLGMVTAITDGGADITIENNTSNKDIIFKVLDGAVDTEIMRIDGSESRIGVGTNVPTGMLHVKNPTVTELFVSERNLTAGANTTYIAQRILASNTTNMGDGFGAAVGFYIQDNAGTENKIALCGGMRSGADDTGTFVIGTYKSGSNTLHVGVDENGYMGIGTTDPGNPLHILNTTTQLKLSYDGTDNCTFGVDTNGDLTITPSGDEVIIPAAKKLTLSMADGTAPMSVTSATVVTNLNADKLDGADLETTWTDSDVKVCSSKGIKTKTDALYLPKATLVEQGDILYASSAGTLAVLTHGTSSQYLKSGGDGANPSWGTPAGAGDCIAPATNTADYIPQWNGADSKTLKDGFAKSDLLLTTSRRSDHITIDPYNYSGITAGTWSIYIHASYINNYFFYNLSNTNLDRVDYLAGFEAGTWTCQIISRVNTADGILDLLIDGASVGTHDNYADPVVVPHIITFTGIAITEGIHTVSIKCSGRNASNTTGYYIAFSSLAFWRTA